MCVRIDFASYLLSLYASWFKNRPCISRHFFFNNINCLGTKRLHCIATPSDCIEYIPGLSLQQYFKRRKKKLRNKMIYNLPGKKLRNQRTEPPEVYLLEQWNCLLHTVKPGMQVLIVCVFAQISTAKQAISSK